MIREDGSKADSKYFWYILHKRSFGQGFLKRLGWAETFPEYLWVSNKQNLGQHNHRYLRLTRIAPKNMIIAEFSRDGETWIFNENHYVEMTGSAAYGFAITNATDNEKLDHVRFANAKFEPAIPVSIRSFSPQTYTPEDRVHVTLEILNAANKTRKHTLTETLPSGWSAEQISHGGIFKEGKVTWEMILNPGNTNVTYAAVSSDNPNDLSLFSGLLGTIPIMGEQSVLQKQAEVLSLQPNYWSFWDSSDDLAQTETTHLSISSTGNIWVNHPNLTLSRLDGYTIQPFSVRNLHKNVQESSSGKVWGKFMNSMANFSKEFHVEGGWYLTFFGRITGFQSFQPIESYTNSKWSYEDAKWKKYNIQEVRFTHPSHYRFYQAFDDQVIIGYNNRLLSFHENTQQIETIKYATETIIGDFVYSVKARNGDLWISGDNGIAKIEKKGALFNTKSTWTEFRFNPNIPFNRYIQPVEQKDGSILFNVYSNQTQQWGLVRFDGESWKTIFTSNSEYNPSRVDIYDWRPKSYAILDDDGTVWLHQLSENGQNTLRKIFMQNQTEESAESVVSGNINRIEKDIEGAIWVASSEGLARMAPRTWRTPREVSGIEEQVHSIGESKDGILWFTTQDHLIRKNQKQWKIYRWLEDVDVSDFSVSLLANGSPVFNADHNVGRNNSLPILVIFNPLEESFNKVLIPPNTGLKQLTQGQDDSLLLLMGHDRGTHVMKYDGKHFESTIPYGEINSITEGSSSFYQSNDGSLWIGVREYIGVYKNGQYTTFGLEEGYTGDEALCIKEISDDKIWVGTNQGILQYDGNEWSVVNDNLGTVRDIIVSKDRSVWAASRTGIHRFYQDSWQTNTKEDGLPHTSVSQVFEDSQGRIWVGTAKGISLYHPDADMDPPQTFISEENTPEIAPGGGKFVYSGIDKWKYTQQEFLLYSYKIDERDWTPFTPETVASVSSLPAGEHQLHVRAMDRNWNIDPNPPTFKFTVLRHWYKEPFFLITSTLGALLTILFACYALSRHLRLGHLVAERTASLSKTNVSLQSEIAERKLLQKEIINISEHEQSSIGQDLHDSLNQQLAGVAYLSRNLKESLEEQHIKESDDVEIIIENVHKSIQQANSIARGLTPVALENDGLISALQEYTKDIENVFHVKCTVQDQNSYLIQDSTINTNLYRITQEAVKNAIRHGAAKNIEITLNQQEQSIQLAIKDDGKGMDLQDTHHNGMGIRGMKNRTTILDGSLEMQSNLDEGTQIFVTIPINRNV